MNGQPAIRVDTLVIGSGPGGAVSGTVLAEAGREVLMLEEGADLALGAAPHFSAEEMLLKYRNAGIGVAMGRSKLAWVEGRCVGGGSEINRGLYHRTPGYVLEDWRRHYRVQGIDPVQMAPHFEACEAVAAVEFATERAPEISRRLHTGASEMGWHASEAPRLYSYPGKGGLHGETTGKQSMSATFIRKFRAAGGELLSSTRVDRLQRNATGWTAQARRRGSDGTWQSLPVHADQVIVACGAVQTPALLRRSGLRRNIGDSLRFHPMVKVVAEFDHEVNRQGDFDPVHQVREFEPHIGMGCSISTPTQLGMALAGRPDAWQVISERWRHMGLYYVQTSAGMASVRNLAGFTDPLVRIRFRDEEMDVMARGIARLAEALFAAGAKRVIPCVPGYPELHSASDIRNLPSRLQPRDGSLSSVHVFCSCPMGEDETICAADSFGRVHGVQGLTICDASLLCTPTSVNPQGTVMAIAHRNAVAMLDRASR